MSGTDEITLEPQETAPAASTQQALDPISQRLQSLQLQKNERRGGGGFRWGRLFFLLLLIGAVVGGYFGFEEYKKTHAQVIPETEAISFGERAGGGVILDVSGYIVPKNKVQIAPQAAGKIIELPIEEGMIVKKGQVICRIEDDTYRAEVDRAKAALALAEAQLLKLKNGTDPEEIAQAKSMLDSSEASLQEAKDNYDRSKKLVNSGASPTVELEKAQAALTNAENQVAVNKSKVSLLVRGARSEDVAVAEAQVAQARATFESAQIGLKNSVIVAPVNGTILEQNAREGELILPQTVITSLCVLADMNELEAEVDIQEREVSRVSVGHPCQVIPDAYPDRIYEAELARMQPQVNRSRGVVPVKVKILKPDNHLLSEMNCRVLFLKRENQGENQIPTVPSRAVTTADGVSTVFVLDENKTAHPRRVKIGKTLGDEIEILDGLKTGEIVLLRDKDPIVDGQSIRPKLLEENKDAKTKP
ncbi:efflux RND transporter periplasmic adaptor subunit [bacterium]|nr:efflux RND transporter periplasmic adaptor subunit [bacterium]